MRTWIVALLLVTACKGKDKVGAPEAAKAEAPAGPAVPKVTVATVLAKNDKPPLLFLVDTAGTVRLGAAKSWAALDANALTVAKKATTLDPADKYVRESFALERDPVDAVKAWDSFSEGDNIALDSLDDPNPSPSQDDPPPPPPEDEVSGGTGTAMALDEGKMGKKDSARSAGSYSMQTNNEDPQVARKQAIEAARAAGILGGHRGAGGSLPYASRDKPLPREDGAPTRVAEVEGVVAQNGTLEKLRAMIVIAPTAKATKLIEIVAETGAAIAVSHDGKIRPLHLQFDSHDSFTEGSWVEARVTARGIVIEAIPDAPIEVAAVDAKQLAAALDKARTARGTPPDAPVDVLVDADVDVQHLIDVVVALDTAGVRVIGMGSTPNGEELSRRGHRIATVSFGQPSSQGDLDKAIIRKVVKSSQPKIKACYDTALASNPALEGTVLVQFFITPAGTVAASAGTGVDPTVSTCIADVIKTLVFPKPKGGGGVQVNYPFSMRP